MARPIVDPVAPKRVKSLLRPRAVDIPTDRNEALIRFAKDDPPREVKVTNLRKPFWPELGITKGDLIQYYVDVAPLLLPHIADRAMVMKRYPNGWDRPFFFMKRAPSPRPSWIPICEIDHGERGVIDFPVIDDLLALIWVINLGCIDLNPWYARCDDVDRPDYAHFDLDPGTAPWRRVVECASILHEALDSLGTPNYAKTSGN